MNLSSLQTLIDETEFLLCHSLGAWRGNIEKARQEKRETPQHLLPPFGELSKAALTIQRLIRGRVEIYHANNPDAPSPRPPRPGRTIVHDIDPPIPTNESLPRMPPIHKDPEIAAISKRMQDLIKGYKQGTVDSKSLPLDGNNGAISNPGEDSDLYDLDEDEDETEDEDDDEEEDDDQDAQNDDDYSQDGDHIDDDDNDDDGNPDVDNSDSEDEPKDDNDEDDNDGDIIEGDDGKENRKDDESDNEIPSAAKDNGDGNDNRNDNLNADFSDEADSEDEADPCDLDDEDEDDLIDSNDQDEDQDNFLDNPDIDNDPTMSPSMRLIHDLSNPKKEIYKLCKKMEKAVRDYPAPP